MLRVFFREEEDSGV